MHLLKLSTRRRTQSEQLGPDLSKDAADEQDIAAMAKVWAHPEDLHLYQVRLLYAALVDADSQISLAASYLGHC